MNILNTLSVQDLKYLLDSVHLTPNITEEQVVLFKKEILSTIRQKNLAELMKPLVESYIEERKNKKKLFTKNIQTLEGVSLDTEARKISMIRYTDETDASFRRRLLGLHMACFARYGES